MNTDYGCTRIFGCTRTFGCTTYSCSGMDSREEALENVYMRAFEDGKWQPRILRTKWWQFWRPTEHNSIEKMILRLIEEAS